MAKFAKGVSGNPGGRPSGVGDLREIARKHTGEAVQVLIQVMGDASAAPSARVGAASALLDRGWGRAHQSIDARISNQDLELDAALNGTASKLLDRMMSNNRRETGAAPNLDVESEGEATPALSAP